MALATTIWRETTDTSQLLFSFAGRHGGPPLWRGWVVVVVGSIPLVYARGMENRTRWNWLWRRDPPRPTHTRDGIELLACEVVPGLAVHDWFAPNEIYVLREDRPIICINTVTYYKTFSKEARNLVRSMAERNERERITMKQWDQIKELAGW